LAGVLTFFLLPDSPLLAKRWLKPDEQRYLQLMLYVTRGEKRAQIEDPKRARRFKWATVMQVFTDGHIYLQALICASNTVPNNGLKFTMPQIIRNMGFTSTNAQLLSAPPYFAGAVAAVVSSLWADKLSRRMPFIVFFQSIVVVSMGVLFQYAPHIATDIPTCYAMVVLACLGVYPIVPGCNAWTVNNLAAAEKRSMGVALMVTVGNVGGFIGSWIFLNKEAPRYPTGFGTSLAFAAAGIVAALLLEYLYWRHNKKWEVVPREEIQRQYSEEQLYQMGDRAPTFKYSL
jgi:predicted MFS family arabinose efflux permease